jgi:signal peptidase
MRFVGRVLFRVAVVLVTAATLGTVALATAVLGVPRLAGLEPLVVLSGSMVPTLQPGGLAYVRPLEAGAARDPTAAIRKGDVITFRSPRDPAQRVSHRVIGVLDDRDGRRFATRGDANAQPDPVLVPADHVVGTVVHHVPHLGYFAAWLRGRTAFLLLTGAPAVLVVLAESRSIARDVRAHRHPSREELHRLLRDLARA